MSGNGGHAGIGIAEEALPEEEAASVREELTAAPEAPKCGSKVPFSQVVYETGLVAVKTVAGVGIGAAVGIGAVVAIVTAEVTLPALLIIKTFGFAGGAVGFLKGLNKKRQ